MYTITKSAALTGHLAGQNVPQDNVIIFKNILRDISRDILSFKRGGF